MKKVICISKISSVEPVIGSENIYTVSVVVQNMPPLELAFFNEQDALSFVSRLNGSDGDKYLNSIYGYIQDNK